MPCVNIKITPGATQEQKARLIAGVTNLLRDELGTGDNGQDKRERVEPRRRGGLLPPYARAPLQRHAP